ncbi:hypothetical protein BMS3Abin16_01304 [archaeon BMS3Abin16]|nr:hypothetical protein BMS3Abin16_01304 [archaeon BMS3Abin16]HDZ62497.1 hypothetical protein [Nitrospirota bacterium]
MQKLRDNSLKIALMIFISGFYIGYTLRFFDVICTPLVRGFLFPIYDQAVASMKPYGGYPNSQFIGYGISESTGFDIFKNNFLPATLLIGTSIIFGLPTMIILFFIGVGAGSSLAEIIEFTTLSTSLQFIVATIIFAAMVVYAGSVGFYICSFLYDTIRNRDFKVEKTFYDHILVTAGLVVLGIIVQNIFRVV